MHTRRISWWLFFLGLAVVLILNSGMPPHASIADEESDSPQAEQKPVAAPPQSPSQIVAVQTPRSPMMTEIIQLLEEERVELMQLEDDSLGADDSHEADQIQRTMEAVKRSTEIAVLRVQLRYALQKGRSRTVDDLENAIELLEDRAP